MLCAQVAKWRSTHSWLPLLEIATLSLVTSGTQLLLPVLGTCQPCAEPAHHHPQRMRSMHPLLPEGIFGANGLLGGVSSWGATPNPDLESTWDWRMHVAGDSIQEDPLYATIVDESNVMDREHVEAMHAAHAAAGELLAEHEELCLGLPLRWWPVLYCCPVFLLRVCFARLPALGAVCLCIHA